MAVDLRKVKKLIELVEESGIAELEVSSGDETVRITMPQTAGAVATVVAPVTGSVEPDVHQTGSQAPSPASSQSLKAPMAGTFYVAPHPDAAPFVEVGAQVSVGDVICIIESMKMMHEIKADLSGQVSEVMITNGQPVGTGEVLFRIS